MFVLITVGAIPKGSPENLTLVCPRMLLVGGLLRDQSASWRQRPLYTDVLLKIYRSSRTRLAFLAIYVVFFIRETVRWPLLMDLRFLIELLVCCNKGPGHLLLGKRKKKRYEVKLRPLRYRFSLCRGPLTRLQLETLLGTNLLEISVGSDFGALKGSTGATYST